MAERAGIDPGFRDKPTDVVHPPDTPKCRACGLPTDAVDDKGPCHPWCIPLDAIEEAEAPS